MGCIFKRLCSLFKSKKDKSISQLSDDIDLDDQLTDNEHNTQTSDDLSRSDTNSNLNKPIDDLLSTTNRLDANYFNKTTQIIDEYETVSVQSTSELLFSSKTNIDLDNWNSSRSYYQDDTLDISGSSIFSSHSSDAHHVDLTSNTDQYTNATDKSTTNLINTDTISVN